MPLRNAQRPRPKQWLQSLARARERMTEIRDVVVEGTLSRMVGMTLEAVGCEGGGQHKQAFAPCGGEPPEFAIGIRLEPGFAGKP